MIEKNIEVEMMGGINTNKFNSLKDFFDKNAKFKKKKERLTLMYFRDKIPLDIKEIKDEPVDLRFRVTNKQPEVVLKYGIFSGENARKEITLPLKPEEVENQIEFLKLLGWYVVVVYAVKTYVYDYNNIEFALVDIKDYGYNFEAEIMCVEGEIENSKESLKKELDILGLKPFDSEGLDNQCNAINNNKNLQFNLNDTEFRLIKKRFKEFF